MSDTKTLNVFYGGQKVGNLKEDKEERLSFQYDEQWIDSNGFSLSLKLPVRKEEHGHLVTKSFFENLMPEGDIKKSIEASVNGSIKDEFNFLKQFGIDCAGAFLITPEDKIETISSQDVKELSREKINEYLKDKVALADAIVNREGARFSLAGAQDKFPIIYVDEKFLIPLGGRATTHIVKPASRYSAETKDSPYNEYFCMKLASKVGLKVPEVDVLPGEYPLYIIKRYDREESEGEIKRIHQQDFCQAQGLTSKKKYETDDGPGLGDNYKLIRLHSSNPIEDIKQFLNWFWFNLFIGNNDSHSKNISFLYNKNKLELTPFYDIVSTAIYEGVNQRFSFKIGGQDLWHDIKITNLEILAKDLDITYKKLISAGVSLSKKIKKQVVALREESEKKYPKIYTFSKIEKECLKRIKHFEVHIFENKKRN